MMAIDFDLTSTPRGLDDLRSLVRAVVAADPADELDWIEWKSTLDLSSKAGCFHVARCILGLANRSVEAARRTAGGAGFVIVGAEPGNLAGVPSIDPSVWVTMVENYVSGDTSPSWSSQWVPVDRVNVLVVTVEPPAPGDPIWPLRREFGGARNGAVFVRRPGRTEPATGGDFDMLQRRLLAATKQLPLLEVEMRLDRDALQWVDASHIAEDIDAWIDTRRAPLLAAAEEVERQRHAPRVFDADARLGLSNADLGQFARLAATLDQSLGRKPDRRSLEEFTNELDGWAKKMRSFAALEVLRQLLEANLVWIEVRNPTEQYLHDVQVKLHVPGEFIKGFDEVDDQRAMPAAPRPLGEPVPFYTSNLGNISALMTPPNLTLPNMHIPSRTIIEDGSLNVTFNIGDLRPFEDDVTDDVYLRLTERPPSGELKGTWTATIAGRDGRIEGTIHAPVEDNAVIVAAALDSSEPDE